MCKNGDGNEKLDVILTILTVSCLSNLKELVLWCKLLLYQVPHPTSSVFLIYSHFMLAGERARVNRKS